MREHYHSIARAYLARHGCIGLELVRVLSGFDFDRPVYEQRLDAGAVIYQLVRRPSHAQALPKLGNWFCLRGATLSGLAIMSGGEGRILAKVRVVLPLVALEGTAAPQTENWQWSGGGHGGATQIFLPDPFLKTHICVLGYTPDVAGVSG